VVHEDFIVKVIEPRPCRHLDMSYAPGPQYAKYVRQRGGVVVNILDDAMQTVNPVIPIENRIIG
jgi:hypothetical protein